MERREPHRIWGAVRRENAGLWLLGKDQQRVDFAGSRGEGRRGFTSLRGGAESVEVDTTYLLSYSCGESLSVASNVVTGGGGGLRGDRACP